jgi:Bacterial dipeptidyl-peptidase Sh3 domain
MTTLDKRLHAFRADLADETLRAICDATRFVKGIGAQCIKPMVAVRRAASPDAMQLTQALWGELATVFERKDGWAWVQLNRDGYVGYVSEEGYNTCHPLPPGAINPSLPCAGFENPARDCNSHGC